MLTLAYDLKLGFDQVRIRQEDRRELRHHRGSSPTSGDFVPFSKQRKHHEEADPEDENE